MPTDLIQQFNKCQQIFSIFPLAFDDKHDRYKWLPILYINMLHNDKKFKTGYYRIKERVASLFACS